MVEGEQMGVAELHNTLGADAHGSNIATELVPGEGDGDLHHTLQRASRPSASAPGWLDRPRGAGRPASETGTRVRRPGNIAAARRGDLATMGTW